jgi:hypothetical protein
MTLQEGDTFSQDRSKPEGSRAKQSVWFDSVHKLLHEEEEEEYGREEYFAIETICRYQRHFVFILCNKRFYAHISEVQVLLFHSHFLNSCRKV